MFADTGLCRLGSHLHVAVLSLRFQVVTWDILWGGTSATQRQKFHTDCIDGCLHYKSGSPWVPNANLFNFSFLLFIIFKCLNVVLICKQAPAKLKCFFQRRILSLKLSQWTMVYNSIARTRGAYNETWIVRVVIESRGLGILSGYYECGPQLLLLENRRKIEPNKIPSCLISLPTCCIYLATWNLSDNPE